MNIRGSGLNKVFLLLGLISLIFLLDHNIGSTTGNTYAIFGFELSHNEVNVLLISLSASLLYSGLKTNKK